MNNFPNVFIGSSNESKDYMNEIIAELDGVCNFQPWDDMVLEPSSYSMEDLEVKSENYDFALFVLHPDDYCIGKGIVSIKPRDNVILEIGLFIKAIGRRNIALIMPIFEASDVRVDIPEKLAVCLENYNINRLTIPTDILSINTIHYGIGSCGPSMRTTSVNIKKWIQNRQTFSVHASCWPLNIAVVSSDKKAVDRLCCVLTSYSPKIICVKQYSSCSEAQEAMSENNIDGAFVDIHSFSGDEGTDLILWARDRYRKIGFALYSTDTELYTYPAMSERRRHVFEHYWRLSKDAKDDSLLINVEDILLLFLVHKISEGRFGEIPGEVIRKLFLSKSLSLNECK